MRDTEKHIPHAPVNIHCKDKLYFNPLNRNVKEESQSYVDYILPKTTILVHGRIKNFRNGVSNLLWGWEGSI